MIRTLILARLAKEERKLGESIDYVRYILHVSLRAFFRFVKIFSISNYRDTLPVDAYHIARIVAARDEDCGTCVQIEVNLAKASGISATALHSVINNNPEELPPHLAHVYRFVEAVVKSTGEEDALRPTIVDQYGEKGLIELALAIGASRFLPVTKRTLGYATKCTKVDIHC